MKIGSSRDEDDTDVKVWCGPALALCLDHRWSMADLRMNLHEKSILLLLIELDTLYRNMQNSDTVLFEISVKKI